MKMGRKHFAGPRNILQTKRQGFCVVFLSILKIETTGPTTGHCTENWSFYLMYSCRPYWIVQYGQVLVYGFPSGCCGGALCAAVGARFYFSESEEWGGVVSSVCLVTSLGH